MVSILYQFLQVIRLSSFIDRHIYDHAIDGSDRYKPVLKGEKKKRKVVKKRLSTILEKKIARHVHACKSSKKQANLK